MSPDSGRNRTSFNLVVPKSNTKVIFNPLVPHDIIVGQARKIRPKNPDMSGKS